MQQLDASSLIRIDSDRRGGLGDDRVHQNRAFKNRLRVVIARYKTLDGLLTWLLRGDQRHLLDQRRDDGGARPPPIRALKPVSHRC